MKKEYGEKDIKINWHISKKDYSSLTIRGITLIPAFYWVSSGCSASALCQLTHSPKTLPF